MGGPHATLYWPSVAGDSGEEALGSALYQKFDVVVILKEQMQVTDEKWINLLCHAHHGTCTQQHINLLKGLVLSSKECPPTDFRNVPWSRASLVTPRHGVHMEWIKAALKEHCRWAKVPLFTCVAEDTIKGRPLRLSDIVEIALGAKVMVTTNVDMDKNIANGSQGEIIEIMLNKNEPALLDNIGRIKLCHLPICMLVKLDNASEKQVGDLDYGVVPIFPEECTYWITMGDGKTKSVKRCQLPMTGAYGFCHIPESSLNLTATSGPLPHLYPCPPHSWVVPSLTLDL
jgi:hypothetical protein